MNKELFKKAHEILETLNDAASDLDVIAAIYEALVEANHDGYEEACADGDDLWQEGYDEGFNDGVNVGMAADEGAGDGFDGQPRVNAAPEGFGLDHLKRLNPTLDWDDIRKAVDRAWARPEIYSPFNPVS